MTIEDAIIEVCFNHPKGESIDCPIMIRGVKDILKGPVSITEFHKALNNVKRSGKVMFVKTGSAALN